MVTVRATRAAFGLEVMTVTDREQLDALVRTAGAEEATLAELDDCLNRLRQVKQAKLALSQLDTDTLRAVLSARRESLGGQHQ